MASAAAGRTGMLATPPRASRRLLPTSATATMTRPKSPFRRANSAKAHRLRAGNSTASMSSSSSRQVCNAPVNRSAAAILRLATRAGRQCHRTSRGGGDGQFGRRVGVRQAAAEGAAGPDGGVPDPPGGLGEQRVLALRCQGAVPGEGADPQAAAGQRADLRPGQERG